MADTSIYKNIKGYSDFRNEAEAAGLAKALTAAQIGTAQAQAKKAQYLDVDKLGKQSIVKAAMGMELSPEEQAAARYIDATKAGMTFDPVTGNMIQKPSLQSTLGINLGGGQQTQGAVTPRTPTYNAPQPQEAPDTPKPPEPVKPDLGDASLQEALAGAAGDPKLQQQIKRDFAKQTMKAAGAKDEKFTKARSSLVDLGRQSTVVQKNINDALDLVRNSMTATGWGNALMGKLPNADARKLNNYLDTIKANIGFDKLQNMRENSPTGGALGQVSDTENKLLQAVNGALDPLQADQLEDNLVLINDLYPQVMKERQEAFALDYGADALPELPKLGTIGNAFEMPPEPTMVETPRFNPSEFTKGNKYKGGDGKDYIYDGKQFIPTRTK